jgi:3-oxoacyl-[acyl-carrier-protein] synthase-3
MNIQLPRPQAPLGIAAVAIHEPHWALANDWFAGTMPRKFAHHTGIESRAISLEDETAMGIEAVRKLGRETGCRLADCRGLVFVSPSFIPPSVARRHLPADRIDAERPRHAARQITRALGLAHCRTVGINWFCCGYARALMLARHRWAPRLGLARDEFLVVVVASRISRITDYGCSQTAGLFGDMASATLLTGTSSRRHPVHFEILHAAATKQPVERPAFDFHVGARVSVPTPDGGMAHEEGRLVYSLDGMAIAEIAPRAMAAAVGAALEAGSLAPDDVRFVVPHQAGTGIVRFTGMKLEELGVRGELVNGLTRHTGNTSACSIPHALAQTWSRLQGVVACPSAAVGSPGKPEVLQGCILLRATALHERLGSAAA